MKGKYFVLLAAVLSILALSGCDALLVEKKGGGELSYDMQQTSDGGYILAGARYLDDTRTAALLIKADSLGNEVWSRDFDIKESDMRAYSVKQTGDSGYILAGNKSQNGPGDAFLIKTDSLGNEEWTQIFGGSDSDYIYSVCETENGGYILAGYTWSYGAGRYDGWLLKADALGNEEWSQTYGGSERDIKVYSVQRTDDGGYILTGVAEAAGSYIPFPWLLKADALGNEEWSQVFEEISRTSGISVQQTQDGGFITVLSGSPYAWSPSDLWLLKTDALGNEEWLQLYDGSVNDYARSVQQTEDGGYILAGGWEGAWLLKTDALGIEEWSQRFEGSSNNFIHSVRQALDGGFIMAGYTRPHDDGSQKALLLKTGAFGDEVWSRHFGDEFVAGHAATPQLILLMAVMALLLFHAIYFLVFLRDMKTRGEKYPAWFIKFLFLAPLAAAWYTTYRKQKNGEAVSGNKFENIAKNLAIHWSIYAWLLPVYIFILLSIFQGPGYAFAGVLAALISGIVFIWLAAWLAPLSILLIITLIMIAWRAVKVPK